MTQRNSNAENWPPSSTALIDDAVDRAVDEAGRVLLGKEHTIRLALCCLLSGGHLLLEDLPGMGKTTLSRTLAAVFGLAFTRIQFTSDLLPADIIGVSIYRPHSGDFQFHPGPVFSQLVLADEINRATPKTQSALLEAMAERQVSTEGSTRELPSPFFVIATQNPTTMAGTFPLPESQLDRFFMCLQIGYPDPRVERELLLHDGHQAESGSVRQCFEIGDLEVLGRQAADTRCSDALMDYVQRLVRRTREHEELSYGLSPRGAMAVVRAARTWAFMAGRHYVLPEDVQAVFPSVVGHRLVSRQSGMMDGIQGQGDLAQRILESVEVV